MFDMIDATGLGNKNDQLLHFQQNKLHNYTTFNYITVNKSFTQFQKLIQTTLKLH